jgi:hypothetical protein
MVWAGRVGRTCSIEETKMLHWKYLCSKDFCESEFTTAEKIRLNRVAVSSVSDSTSH